MKRIIAAALVVVLALSLTACGCKHERWIEANCISPATCADCGKTQGQPAAHQWVDATCSRPKHCAVCNLTQGELGDHIWKETFLSLNICTECGMIEGEAVAFELSDNQKVSIDGHSSFSINGWGCGSELVENGNILAKAENGKAVLWLEFDYTNLSGENKELFRIFTAPVLLMGDNSYRGQFAMNGRYELNANERHSFYICFEIPEDYIENGEEMNIHFFDNGLTYGYTIVPLVDEIPQEKIAG